MRRHLVTGHPFMLALWGLAVLSSAVLFVFTYGGVR